MAESVDDFTKKVMGYGRDITQRLVDQAQSDGVEPGELLYSIIIAAMNLSLTMAAGEVVSANKIVRETVDVVLDHMTNGDVTVVRGDEVVEAT